MVAITETGGRVLHLADEAIVLVVGPYPHDVGPHTYVYGATPAPIITAESAASVASRLDVAKPLAELTRPNGTPAWISGPAVTGVRDPLNEERPDSPDVAYSVILIGRLHQSVQERYEQVVPALLASGAKRSIFGAQIARAETGEGDG